MFEDNDNINPKSNSLSSGTFTLIASVYFFAISKIESLSIYVISCLNPNQLKVTYKIFGKSCICLTFPVSKSTEKQNVFRPFVTAKNGALIVLL